MFGKIRIAVIVSLLVFSVPGYSVDANGKAVAVGYTSCGEWVMERRGESPNMMKISKGWIGGYITAFNYQTQDVYDVRGDTDLESIYLWLDNYCRDNPLKSVPTAMDVLMSELWPDRTIKAPE